MFWNLVHYEFKNVNKWYLALYAAVLVLSALIGIQTQGFKIYLTKKVRLLCYFSSSYSLWWLDAYTCDFNHFLDY